MLQTHMSLCEVFTFQSAYSTKSSSYLTVADLQLPYA